MATFKYQCTAVDAASCTAGVWVPDESGIFGVSLSVDDAMIIFVPTLMLLAVAWVWRLLNRVVSEN